MKNLLLILTLTFTLLLVACGDKNETQTANPDKKTILLDLGSVPAARAEGNTPETIDKDQPDREGDLSSAEENIIDFYRDDFDSFDPDFWTVIEEKTGNLIPDQAHFQDGKLLVEAAKADRNPLYHSIPIDASSGDTIRIKRRALIHAGNEYANISFTIYGTEGTDLTVSKDIKTETIASIQYLDFQYDKGRYPITKGVLLTVPGYKESGEYKTLEPLFDTWVDEELEYHTDTGKVIFTINGQSAELQGSPLTLPRFRVYMNAYGWHTGHRVTVDYLEISVESPELQPSGISSITELLTESVEPSPERTIIKTDSGISVSIPGLASESVQNLSITELEIDDPEIVSALEVKYGNIHSFDSAVKITLPIPEGTVPQGEPASDYIHPVSYNTSTGIWVPEPALYEEETVTIISSHLSAFALKLGPGINLDYKAIAATTKAEAVESAWSSMTGNLDWVAQGQTYASMVNDNPFLDVLGKQLGTVGTGFAIIDIAKNMAQGNDLNAGLGAVRLVSSWALGKFATLGTQIAGIGTFFIDYSLNTLATETLAAQYAAFEKAYTAYYKSEGRSVYDWYEEIKGYLMESSTSDEVGEKLTKSINEYVASIWKDEAAFEGYLAEAKGHGWGGDAGLTPEIKRKLEANHKVILGQTLKPAISRAFEWIENQAYDEQFKAAYKAQGILKQDIRYWVDVFGNRKNDKLEVVVLHNNTAMFTVKPSNSGAVDFLGFTTLTEFFKSPRPTHILLQGYLQIDENTTVPVSMKQKLVWDSFSPTIKFDIDRSQYMEEKVEDQEEEEEDIIDTENQFSSDFDNLIEKMDPVDFIDLNYSIFELPVTSAAKTETVPPNISVSFGSLSETKRAPKDPDTGEYLSAVYLKDSNGMAIASILYNNEGYLQYGEYIPLTGTGKSVSGDGTGGLISEEFYLDGQLHGPGRTFYGNGNIATVTYFRNGALHGPVREYYENGKLQSEGTNVNGQREGLSTTYYENGQVESRSMVKGWAYWGPYEVYYENGQLSVKGEYLPYEKADRETFGGVETGYWQRFYESGALSDEEWYTNDGSFIESKSYNEAGWMEMNIVKKNGKMVEYTFDSKGNKTGEFEY